MGRLALRIVWSLCCARALAQEPPVRFGTTVVIPAGLHGQIYHIKRNSQRLPDLRKLKPAGTIYTKSLNVPPQEFDLGFPGVTRRYEWFAIDYTGRFWIQNPGLYHFLLTSDDGSKLFIDDRLIVDNDGIHPATDRHGAVELGTGVHRIEVAYFQGPRFQVALTLRVARPGQHMRIFDVDDYQPPPGVEIPRNEDMAEPHTVHSQALLAHLTESCYFAGWRATTRIMNVPGFATRRPLAPVSNSAAGR